MKKFGTLMAALCALCASIGCAAPFGAGWTLESAASSLEFSAPGADAARFDRLEGTIGADGAVDLRITLDSLETGTELMNARLRFLLLETFRLPEARVTARLDPDALEGLRQRRNTTLTLPVTLSLNEVSQQVDATLLAVLISDDIVSVTTTEPLRLDLRAFNLLPGLAKLEAAADAEILPQTDVTLDLLFRAEATAQADPVSREACAKRIATIASTDQVYFTSGSAELEAKSFPLLDAVADTILTCNGLTLGIEGHTDDRGTDDFNQALSEARARAVVTYLTVKGVPQERLRATGFGEKRPIADNSTKRGRWQNRRIEFKVAAQ